MNKQPGGFLISRSQFPYTPHLTISAVGGRLKATGTRSQLKPYNQSYEPLLSGVLPPVTTTSRFLHTPQTWSRP